MPDVIVLDLGLPDIDGVEVCKRLRQWTEVPVIVLSALDSEDRKVLALDSGADDYVTKPFGMHELEARLRVALRHAAGPQPTLRACHADGGPRSCGPRLARRRGSGGVRSSDERAEFDLLAYLARNAGKVCTHRTIPPWGSGEKPGRSYGHETALPARLCEPFAPANSANKGGPLLRSGIRVSATTRRCIKADSAAGSWRHRATRRCRLRATRPRRGEPPAPASRTEGTGDGRVRNRRFAAEAAHDGAGSRRGGPVPALILASSLRNGPVRERETRRTYEVHKRDECQEHEPPRVTRFVTILTMPTMDATSNAK